MIEMEIRMVRTVISKVKVMLVASVLAAMAMNSHATAWMSDFYASAGANANITAPAAIATQNAVGFAGGGVSWRIPSTSFSPIQITPPSIKAGCGGIDAYLGAYSFVNKAQFVQALRNFGQSAIGYFFQLALKSMAPEVSTTLENINDIAQRINALNINSCKMATIAVDGIVDKIKSISKEAAVAEEANSGAAVDTEEAKENITGNPFKIFNNAYQAMFGKPQAAVTRADYCAAKPVDINTTMWLLCNANAAITDDEKELIMSLFGTSVYRSVPNQGEGAPISTPDPLAPTIDFTQLLGNPGVTTETLEIYRCSNPECTLTSKVVEPNHKSFTTIVENAITEIFTNVVNRSATTLTPDTQTVLRLSSVPIWRSAAMAATGGMVGATAQQLNGDLAQYAAIEAAVNFLNHYSTILQKSIAGAGTKAPGPVAADKDELLNRIIQLRKQALEKQAEIYGRGNPWQKLAQLQDIEKQMMSNLSQQLAANQRFNHRR